MRRLIDADAMLKWISQYYIDRPLDSDRWVIQDMAEMVRTQPTVDAVEVVRCGECKHQRVFEYTDRRFKNPVRKVYGCELSEDSPVCLDDEFCSRGERKEKE